MFQNKILRRLPDEEKERLLEVSEHVCFSRRQVLHHFKLPIEFLYFIESGAVSAAAKVADETFVEVWLIGCEGLVGAPMTLSVERHAFHRCMVRVAGEAWRIRFDDLIVSLEEMPTLRALVHHYIATVLVQCSQSGACNSTHELDHRLARWLSLARLALRSDDIPLTHDDLAQILGCRRAGITECIKSLRQSDLISTARGLIRILDSDTLAASSCECLRLINREGALAQLHVGQDSAAGTI